MTWLKGADALLVPSSLLRNLLQPKINLECALKKNKKQLVFWKMFSRIVSGHNL